MMKIKTKHIVLILALGLFAGLLAQCVKSREPTAERLIKELNKNQIRYDAIVQMLSKDEDVGIIGPGYVCSLKKGVTIITNHYEEGASDLNITDERLLEYQMKMESIGVQFLGRNYLGDVNFGIWGSGFGGNTHHKGIIWIPDSSSSTTNTPYELIKIKDGWYIYED